MSVVRAGRHTVVCERLLKVRVEAFDLSMRVQHRMPVRVLPPTHKSLERPNPRPH
jgi:hypothetical protein